MKRELVSRDRGGDYASAAYAGAPQAVQCADRFHLLHNLGKALEGVLSRHLAAHRNRQTEKSRATSDSIAQVIQPPNLSPMKAELSQAKREERLAQYCAPWWLSVSSASRRRPSPPKSGLAMLRFRAGYAVTRFPNNDRAPAHTSLDPHLPRLAQRWEAGCHTTAQLHRELLADGYTHGYNSV
jgi:hypothetical protein